MNATTARISFLDRLARGDVLIADGATGTTCQRMGLPIGVAPEEWVFSDPDRIIELHRGFAEAGSDIVLTCTFGGTSIRLADGPLAERAGELNRRAAELAREAVGPDILVGRIARPHRSAVRAARPALARRGGRRLCRAGRGARRRWRRPAPARDDVLPGRGRSRHRRRAPRDGSPVRAGVLVRPRHAHDDGHDDRRGRRARPRAGRRGRRRQLRDEPREHVGDRRRARPPPLLACRSGSSRMPACRA